MKTTINKIVVMALMALIPLLAGCLGSGGFNPVADNSLSDQVNASLTAESDDLVSGQVLGARARPQTLGKSRWSYAEPPFVVVHKVKNGNGGPGSLKVRVLPAASADNIFITLDSMKVKPREGAPRGISIISDEIDLKNPTALAEILAGSQLPNGVYNYMEFRIKSGRVVVGGVSFPLKIPSNRVRFFGSFEIKDNFTTDVSIRFFNKLSLKVKQMGKQKVTEYLLNPIVKISSTLTQKVVAAPDGDVKGVVLDYVKKTPISGVAVSIEGTSFSGLTDANGVFSFVKVPNGTYNVKLSHADYLDKSSSVVVKGGEIADISCEMNPAVIRSSVGNTGWFSQFFPYADANGAYAEMALETPVAIDFVSLAFVKAEMVFDAEFRFGGGARMSAFVSSSQQVQVIKNLGGWWVGNNALLGSALGYFTATQPSTHYTVNVTDFVRANPSAAYFFAARNEAALDIRMQNVQLSIYYR
ncbi:MAG TPA: carboxypeptidase-like regulatory domain-containing protein [Candidatus Ozemobacteraceae bacterium]|nr:carboxypeptidase-like regulatory domain-containing protein [Candidatus Ozemobacteraceae bacterium]